MRKLIAVAAVVATAGISLAAIPAFGATKSISVGDNFFKAKSVSVRSGTTIKWTWKGSAPHNVTVTSGPKKFHSKTQMKGSYSRKLFTKGTYRYVCTIHAGMSGKITVK
jgi:plastocyanin